MYRDSEQSHGDYTLDTYPGTNCWVCEWWHRMKPHINGRVETRKRKDAIALAKHRIDELKKGGE